MKTFTLFVALLLLASVSVAQDYAPFNDSSSKRFFNVSNPADNDYFFHNDSTNLSGDTVIFNQYHSIQYTQIWGPNPNGCQFWGGTTGEVLDTTWLGNQLKWNQSTREIILTNELNELLTFDFGLPVGASAQFYSDGTTNYLIEHTSTELQSFLSISDSVHVFVINAFDTGGSSASSPLNNFEIRLSKNYGLLSFIDCNNFPNLQVGYEIQGQTNPFLGTYQLTYDDCYPWQVGDVLQYSSYQTYGINGPPPNNSYQTSTVIDRIETADSVKIYLSSTVQVVSPSSPIPSYTIGSNNVFFKKGTPISERPWNMTQSDTQLVVAVEDSADHCGLYDRYKTSENFTIYCDSCLCFGGFDGFGQTISNREYVRNYGIFRSSYTSYGPINSTPYANAGLIYSNVNGVECGTFWNSQDELFQFELSIAPNPTKDIVKIESDQQIETIRVLDLSGRVLYSQNKINQKFSEISLASFQKGAYILEVTANGSTQTQTIIRE